MKHPFSDKYDATAEAVLTDYLSTEDSKVYANGILAEIDTIKCFKTNNVLAKHCGIT